MDTFSTFMGMFQMPVYQRCQESCWRMDSYRWQTAVMVELMKLQHKNEIPSSVTTEDMMDLLMTKNSMTLAVQQWHSTVESCFDPALVPLLNMLWDVNIILKRREVEFKARILLTSPENKIPDEYKHRMASSVAKKYASSLREQEESQHSASQLVTPQEMVLQVVPRVVLSFWLPQHTTQVCLPPQDMNFVAVCVTKAVEDSVLEFLTCHLPYIFSSRFKRDKLVQSIVTVLMEQGHTPRILRQTECLDAKLLRAMIIEATKQICPKFLPRRPSRVSVRKSPGRTRD